MTTQSSTVPMKAVRNSGLRIVLLIDCIAAIPAGAGNLPSAVITVTENTKNSPAIRPEPIAAANVRPNDIRPILTSTLSVLSSSSFTTPRAAAKVRAGAAWQY